MTKPSISETPTRKTDFQQKLVVKNHYYRELLAEFIGTAILLAIGCSVVASNILHFEDDKCGGSVNYFGTTFGFVFAAFIGITGTIAISGGHINPVVTVTMATMGKFPWNKVIPYSFMQVAGAYVGAGVAYLAHYKTIQSMHGKIAQEDWAYGSPCSTGSVFTLFPAEHMGTGFEGVFFCFLDQFIGTAALLFGVMILADQQNLNIPMSMQPFYFALLIACIGMGYGKNTGGALNSARDLGPRLFMWTFGYGAKAFDPLGYHFWWAAGIAGPHLGGLAGAWAYDFLIGFHHPENGDAAPSSATCMCKAVPKAKSKSKLSL